MQLNLTTDYAVRVVLMLSDTNRSFSASELAQALAIPPNYLMKVLAKLRVAGLVSSTRGVKGGYYLTIPAEQITFQAVFDAMDDSVTINRCLEPDHYCSRKATENCPVRAFYTKVQKSLDELFSQTSIVSLTEKGQKVK